jgi:hypothetical protein
MLENMFVADNTDFARLRDQGFTETQAILLMLMKEHVEEHIEYRERVEEQRRLDFARWLVENNRIGK